MFTALKRWLKRALTLEQWVSRRELGGVSASGVPVSVERALGLSAVWCGVKVISEAVGMMPLVLYRRGTNGVRDRADSDPLYWLLHDEPNPEMTRPVFFETLQSHCLLYGNGFAEIERSNAGAPLALWPIHPTRTKVDRNDAGELVYRVNNGPGRQPTTLSAFNVLHVPGLGPDGSVGWQLIENGRDVIGFALAAQQYGSSWFKNAGRPGGVLEHPGQLSEVARENLRKSWQKMHAGADNAGGVALLEEGVKFTPLTATHEQAQYRDLLGFFVYEVARLLNCPPSKMHDLGKATWGNLETLNQDFLTTTLQPWLTKWEAEISRKCLGVTRRGRFYPEFLTDAIVRLNYTTRVDGLTKLTGGPIYTVNEARRLENLPPVEGGDVLRTLTAPAPKNEPNPDPTKPTDSPPTAEEGDNAADQ